jgi:hypothetical protein
MTSPIRTVRCRTHEERTPERWRFVVRLTDFDKMLFGLLVASISLVPTLIPLMMYLAGGESWDYGVFFAAILFFSPFVMLSLVFLGRAAQYRPTKTTLDLDRRYFRIANRRQRRIAPIEHAAIRDVAVRQRSWTLYDLVLRLEDSGELILPLGLPDPEQGTALATRLRSALRELRTPAGYR